MQMNDKVRRQISYEAARLMYARSETEYRRAKLRAARLVVRGRVPAADLPTNREIREEIQVWARLQRGNARSDLLGDMRLHALAIMQLLRAFRPRLTGAVLTGQVHADSTIEVELLCDNSQAVTNVLDQRAIDYQLEQPGPDRATHTAIVISGPITTLLYLLPEKQGAQARRRAPAIDAITIGELEQLIGQQQFEYEHEETLSADIAEVDRFQVYESLLLPLEHVQQKSPRHPEGDVLYHSLQVFEHARDALPYDEEFLLAALLHDVGKAIDPRDHVPAGLEALDRFVSERTVWLITHLADAHALREGTLGVRSRRRLEADESFEELLLLAKCDRLGRQRGAVVPQVDEALSYVRDLSRMCG